MSDATNWKLSQYLTLQAKPTATTLFSMAKRARAGRYFVTEFVAVPFATTRNSTWFVQRCDENSGAEISFGDAPTSYHPRYVMAVLSAKNSDSAPALSEFPIPEIAFTTPESVRRSMTLNSMRMSLEYFESGSLRVLDLVKNRLREGQRDVVHDLCVYLMRHLLDIRARDREARLLRAEAVAAFLGLDLPRVETLFLAPRPTSRAITQKLQENLAGPIRREIDVTALIENQFALLRPQIRETSREEAQLFDLLDSVITRLRCTQL